MPAAWSSADTAISLLGDAGRLQSRAWIAAYLLSRAAPEWVPGLRTVANRATALSMAGLGRPLHVTADSGGLATYYEIVTQDIYRQRNGAAATPGGTVVDVGANVGVYSMLAADQIGPSGRLVSVEPHPLAYTTLARNLAQYPLDWTPYNLACGEETGEITLHFVPGRLSVTSVHPRADRTGSVSVPVRPLDDLLADAAVTSVDVLKVDVEGFECEVLRGATRTLGTTRRAVIETNAALLPEVTSLLEAQDLRSAGEISGMWGISNGRIAFFER